MSRKGHEHTTKIGAFVVKDGTGMVMTCHNCGTLSLSQDELAGYERRAARLVLTTAEHVGGDVLKYARRSLGLRQKDLATLLDTNEQQVSRWEHDAELDRRLRLAVAALLEIALRGEAGLSELAANASQTLEVQKAS